MERIQPFLKWAGGKYKLVDKITSLFPLEHSGRYLEPFLGAGAVALNVEGFSTVIANDNNADLINVWTVIRMQPGDLIEQCEELFSGIHNCADGYYALREEFNRFQGTDVRRAALFIYLNKHGFNGLCRYNKSGGFNVPFGKYKTVKFDAAKIRKISERFQGWALASQDYGYIMLMAEAGDVVYCDPPYVTDDQVKAGFTAYSAGGFTLQDQENLAVAAHGAALRGATVIVSNHNTTLTKDLYHGWGATIIPVEVQRNISCKGDKRHVASELLAVFPAGLPNRKLDKAAEGVILRK